MTELPDSITARLALWWRRRRGRPWRRVAMSCSSQELTDRAAEMPTGDVIMLPIDQDPNVSWLPPEARSRILADV